MQTRQHVWKNVWKNVWRKQTTRPGMFILLLVLTFGLLSVTDSAQAQCPGPQGNAWLSFSGIPQIGGTVHLGLAGRAKKPFILAMDTQKGTTNIPGIGNICLTPGLFLLISGVPIPNNGLFTMEIPIPNDTRLIGRTFYFQAAVADDTAPNKTLALSNLASVTLREPLPVTSVFFEDFEVGQNYWFANNGLWQTGTPAANVGPAAAWSGVKCNGTNLAGKYPSRDANTRLVSPGMLLPAVNTDEEIRMTLRMWFDTEDVRDACSLQVSTDMITWTNLTGCPPISGWNKTWIQLNADLTQHASKTVYLGFQFTSSDYKDLWGTWFPVNGYGIYIDDVHVFKGVPVLNTTEDWESGIGSWWGCDNGLWEVGTPGIGPKSTPSGKQCAGILLNAVYPTRNANTRLVSPRIKLPASPPRMLTFKHWFLTEVNRDVGSVQVSIDGGKTWATQPQSSYSGNSQGWTPTAVPLAKYADMTIQIAFNFTSSDYQDIWGTWFPVGGDGWYIDDIEIR